MLQDTENLEELEQVIMAITVTPKPGASTSNSPKNIGIVIEGMEVITWLGDIARACSVLLGLTYALNLDYPRQLKYTFEVFQTLFLDLDDSKLSNKVQSLKSKLQAWNETVLQCRLLCYTVFSFYRAWKCYVCKLALIWTLIPRMSVRFLVQSTKCFLLRTNYTFLLLFWYMHLWRIFL